MAFTVYGPGVRDPVPSDKLFEKRSVEQAQAIAPTRAIPGSEEEQSSSPHEYSQKGRAKQAYKLAQHAIENQPARYAYQIMTSPVITLARRDTIGAALELFRDKRFRHAPIIDENQLVGIISDRDLLNYLAGLGETFFHGSLAARLTAPIEQLVKTRVLTATRDTDVRHIARMLFEHRVGAMPIVTDDGTLDGIITRSDILRAVIQHFSLELWA